MSDKTEVKKNAVVTPGTNIINKRKKEKPPTDRLPRKTKKRLQKSSIAQIDSVEESAVGAVKANSSATVRGSSDLANTGTIISYD